LRWTTTPGGPCNTSRTRPGVNGGRFTSMRGIAAVSGSAKFSRQHCLAENTFRRGLKQIAGEQAAGNLAEYQAELRREKHREERAKQQRTRQRRAIWFDHRRAQSGRSSVLGDACGGDELDGLDVRAYAAGLKLSRSATDRRIATECSEAQRRRSVAKLKCIHQGSADALRIFPLLERSNGNEARPDRLQTTKSLVFSAPVPHLRYSFATCNPTGPNSCCPPKRNSLSCCSVPTRLLFWLGRRASTGRCS
jgi:hypothetical protein